MTIRLQSHIHLAASLGSGPENAPIYTWLASERTPVINFNVEIIESLTGARYDHAIETDGQPVRYQDFYYAIKLQSDETRTTLDYVNRLISLAGRRLYLVDHYHPNDGEDHTPSVRTVRMTKPFEFQQNDPMLQFYYVGIYLSDINPL